MGHEPKDESLSRWGNEGGSPPDENDQPRCRPFLKDGVIRLGMVAVLILVMAVALIAS